MSVNPPRNRNLGDRLYAAGRRFEERLIRGVQEAGYPDVRVAHGRIFQLIDRDGTRIVDLAVRAGMTKQSMGELVDDLEKRGYVERRPDPTDRRARLVALTDRGRAQARAGLRMIGRLERESRERLGEARYAALLEALDDLTAP